MYVFQRSVCHQPIIRYLDEIRMGDFYASSRHHVCTVAERLESGPQQIADRVVQILRSIVLQTILEVGTRYWFTHTVRSPETKRLQSSYGPRITICLTSKLLGPTSDTAQAARPNRTNKYSLVRILQFGLWKRTCVGKKEQ